MSFRSFTSYPVREWQKLRERNEALDCYVYARAAASAVGLDRFGERQWRELERHLGLGADAPEPSPAPAPDDASAGLPSKAAKPRRKVIRSKWMG